MKDDTETLPEQRDNAATKRAVARGEAHEELLSAWEEIDQAWGRVTTQSPTAAREIRERLDKAVNGIKAALDALDLPYVRTQS